jgi:hypothetical protein
MFPSFGNEGLPKNEFKAKACETERHAAHLYQMLESLLLVEYDCTHTSRMNTTFHHEISVMFQCVCITGSELSDLSFVDVVLGWLSKNLRKREGAEQRDEEFHDAENDALNISLSRC